MKKETFSDKMIKRFYGITGPLDEQKRQQAVVFVGGHAPLRRRFRQVLPRLSSP